ncbi:spore germination protein GerPC [Paenibacillus sp. SN-8-1]|uniref:spore germination protein GerPC n=1 Tax=Paenibacillus sp. SN-8-1 TaxID=3435409 RepID=UPI003D9A28A9
MHPYYYQQLASQLQSITARLDQLEASIKGLSQAIDEMKSSATASTGGVQYHFDLLKIEKLEGTLNIGTTPGNGQSIEHIAVGDKQTPSSDHKDVKDAGLEEINRRAKEQVMCFLDEEVPVLFNNMLAAHQLNLTDAYKQQVMDDIRRQIDDRIQIYAKQVNDLPDLSDQEQKIAMVTTQLKRDIQTALNTHIKHTLLGK